MTTCLFVHTTYYDATANGSSNCVCVSASGKCILCHCVDATATTMRRDSKEWINKNKWFLFSSSCPLLRSARIPHVRELSISEKSFVLWSKHDFRNIKWCEICIRHTVAWVGWVLLTTHIRIRAKCKWTVCMCQRSTFVESVAVRSAPKWI